MDKIVYCREVGFECEGAVRGPDEDSVLANVARHARDGHGVTEITPELVERVRSVMRDASSVE